MHTPQVPASPLPAREPRPPAEMNRPCVHDPRPGLCQCLNRMLTTGLWEMLTSGTHLPCCARSLSLPLTPGTVRAGPCSWPPS